MSGKAIGTTLSYGFRGCVTRTPDTIIQSYINGGTDNIQFGDAVIFDAGKVRKIKSTDNTASALVGIAVRRIGQPYEDSNDGYYYKPGDMVDVLVRGTIAVELAATTSIAARGAVYVACGSQSGEAAGSIYCASGTGRLQMPNAIFATGKADANKIAEVTILTRSV